jgi:hypothetical protein
MQSEQRAIQGESEGGGGGDLGVRESFANGREGNARDEERRAEQSHRRHR